MKSTQAGRFLTIAAASAALLFGTAQAQRQLSQDVSDVLAVEPAHSIQIPLNQYGYGYQTAPGPASTEFYRISRDLFIDLASGTMKASQAFEAVRARGTLVRSFVSNESDAESGERVADAGEYPIGQYAAVVTSGSRVTLTPVTVTTIGVLAGSTGTAAAFWAVNLSNFSAHRERTQFSVFSGSSRTRTLSDRDGLAVADLKTPPTGANSAILAQASDGSIGVMSRYWYNESRGETAFVQTDRPLYREGQRVYFRAIYRTGDIGSFAPPDGKRRIRILDEDNTKIYDRTLKLDRYGSVRGDFVLSDSARLGAYRILVDGNDWGPYGFQVQAYKKPEYEADLSAPRHTIVGGRSARFSLLAKYFFGRPAAGMHVAYTAVAEPQYLWFSPFDRWFPRNYQTKTLAQGTAVTDDNGVWTLHVPTQHVEYSQSLEVTANLRDASGRTVSTAAAMQIVPADFSIDITQDRWFAQTGHAIAFGFTAHSYETQKAETRTLHVTITHQAWNGKAQRYEAQSTDLARDVTTAEKTAVAFTPEEPGMYALRATGTDSAGNIASATSSLWVSDPRGGEPLPGMQQPLVTFSKSSYKPGERMQALITLPVRDRDVLAVLSTDRVAEARVVHVHGFSTTVGFAEPDGAQHLTLSVSLPQEIGVMNGQANVTIVPAPRVLNVAVSPDRAKYEPGQRAEFRVHVTDVNGKPVRTQIGISVVDAALLALLPDSSNIADTFYGATSPFYPEAGWYRPNRMLKTIAAIRSSSAGNLVKPGTTADVYAAPRAGAAAGTPGPQGMNGPVRSTFADTAYWVGDAQTDENGDGRIVFTWPDNLTTWVAKAVAVDDAQSVGQGNGKALVTKDFLVRLELPRFLRKGDKTTIGGIAHGVAGSAHARLQLDVNADPLEALIAFDHTASASTSWPYTAPGIGDQTFVLRGSDGPRNDAMQMTIPIESSGTAEHERDAGTTQTQSTLAVSLPAGYDAGVLRVQLTPSVAAQLVENVRLLDVYPYYCTEQTMSAALPAVFVDAVLKRTHLQRTADQNTAAIVKHALARLAQLQHGDGSWGWWENDDGHPFMTAYALYGLSEFRKAGYDVSRNNMYSRGIDALVSLLETQRTDTLRFWGGAQQGSEWNTRAYMLFSLASAAPDRVPQSLLRQTIGRAKELNSYALATLGLAVHELGDDATARRLLAMLNARAIDNGTYRYWTGESWHYAWEDDPIETTAYALRLNAALGDAAAAGRTVAFLRSEEHGSWWFTTKDTAAAIYAIAQTVPDSSPEFSPDETVRVSVDGRVVKTLHVTKAVLESRDADIAVPASSLKAGSTLAIERSGTGALYWSSDFTRYAPPWVHVTSDKSRSIFARLFPKQPPLSVTRTYDTGHKGAWRVGDEVKVTVTVRADQDVQYVAIEDPFPAGVEYQPLQGQTGQDWSGVQFFDDRAVFFADTVYKQWPVTLQYSLRVTTPGTYTAPGPNAYAMYGPPVAAQGDTVTVAVQP